MQRLAVVLLLGFGGWAQAAEEVPANLKPRAGETLARQAQAIGDQVYTCDGTSWILLRPDARLLDESGKEIGSHFAGPTWQWSDGSRVTGRPVANAMPDPDSIPWLLLTAVDHQGDGVLKNVSSIQRLSTKGGKAPGGGCDAAQKGKEYRSHYTAVYYFYVRQ
jgi:hypothetical protein